MARADGSLRNLLTCLNRIDVLVIDDWAMAPLSEPERRDIRMVPSVEVTVALHDNRRASQPKCNYSEVDCIHLNGATDWGKSGCWLPEQTSCSLLTKATLVPLDTAQSATLIHRTNCDRLACYVCSARLPF